MSSGWLLDNSAWSRLDAAGLEAGRREEVADLLAGGRLYTCLPFMLEAGVSARDPADWKALAEDLGTLPEAFTDAVVERRAREAQLDLVRAGMHRGVPLVDLLLAAIAERHDLTLLHYGRDFDRLAEVTSLRFSSEWLAPAGAL